MGYDMNEIRSIFMEVIAKKSLIQDQEIEPFLAELGGFLFTDEEQPLFLGARSVFSWTSTGVGRRQ